MNIHDCGGVDVLRPAERHGGWVKQDRRPIIIEISSKYRYTAHGTRAILNTTRYALNICEDDLQSTSDPLQSPTARASQLDQVAYSFPIFSHITSPAMSLVAPCLPERTTLIKLGRSGSDSL